MAAGQNAARIRLDASYLSAEGRAENLFAADSTALAGLSAKIATQSGLSPAVSATYLDDLRRVSSRLVEGHYTVLRYLPSGDIGNVFAPRTARVQELIARAQETGDAQYYTLAYTLALSLPAYPADLLESLRHQSSGSWTLQDFVSREAEAVLAALKPRRNQSQPNTVSTTSTKSVALTSNQPQTERITVKDTVIVERELARMEIEHTFSRRDTLVIIQGSRESNTTSTPQQDVSRVKERSPLQGFAQIQASLLPELSYGAMLGLGGQYWGAYLRFSSNFRSISPVYDCMSDGTTGFGLIWTSGDKAVSRLDITGGAWLCCADYLKCYAGAGYGQRGVYWADMKGDWARVTDYCAQGVAIDVGLILEFGHFSLSAGGVSVAFRQYSLHVGVGVSF